MDREFRNTDLTDEIWSVILAVQMKKLARALSSPVMSSVLSVVILGALCFSVGEGLRLTPFPVSTPAQSEEPHFSLNSGMSPSQYGPLDVPAQNQKRSKRQVLDLAGPADAGTRYAAPNLSSLLDCESTKVFPVLSVRRPAGRAPPFLF
jgi:hypothetical protein